jgi:hypothetical protein
MAGKDEPPKVGKGEPVKKNQTGSIHATRDREIKKSDDWTRADSVPTPKKPEPKPEKK